MHRSLPGLRRKVGDRIVSTHSVSGSILSVLRFMVYGTRMGTQNQTNAQKRV